MNEYPYTYELTGTVSAPDGSLYEPRYIGGFFDSRRVRDALIDGCRRRGDVYEITVTRSDGRVETISNRNAGWDADGAAITGRRLAI